MIRTEIPKLYHYYPCTVCVIGAMLDDKINFMSAAWNGGLSFEPPLFGVSVASERFTYNLIKNSREFTCNFMPIEEVELVHGCGRLSGSDIDKVKSLSIPLEDSELIRCPTIASAYAAYECKVIEHHPFGDHELFVGEVIAVHVREGIMKKNGILDTDKVLPAMYMGSNTYIAADAASRKELQLDR